MLLRFSIAAACVFSLTTSVFGQQSPRGSSQVAWPYHPNRLGTEAYMQGGAFVANTGNVTAMLFNPAGLAKMPGRLTATVEGGWGSTTEYIPFFNINIASGFQPVQFAGVAWQPHPKFAMGAFYARPTHYDIDFEPIAISTVEHPEGTGGFFEATLEREQTSLGLIATASLGKQLYLGGGMEWRRSSVQEEINQLDAEGDADAVRFSAGAILQVRQWHMGVSAQTKYKASGDLTYEGRERLSQADLPADRYGDNHRLVILDEKFPFYNEEPAIIRFGIATPHAFGRLRFSADAEYKDFDNDVPIERWQFYGGGNFQITPNLDLGFGTFTFRKDYSAYVDGPESEIFLTVGAAIELAQFRLSGSFMDGDLFSQDFAGQQFINFAIGYVIP